MPDLQISLAFFATALFLGIAPGPDNIFVLTQSALFGTRAGIATTFGLVTGVCFHTLAVALGVAALMLAYPWSFNILKGFGAAYLCWLAWLSIRASMDPATARADDDHALFPGYMALFRRGIIMNVTNPKVCLFFLAFLPQFCRPDAGNTAMQIIWFGWLFIVATIIVFCGVACAGGKLANWLAGSTKAQMAIHRLAALIFVGLAIALLCADIT